MKHTRLLYFATDEQKWKDDRRAQEEQGGDCAIDHCEHCRRSTDPRNSACGDHTERSWIADKRGEA